LQANQSARDLIHPGITSGEIDRAAREIIEKSGYGKYFLHRTGHGIGLEAHEEPYIQAESTFRLMPGMVFTIEPGIYLPGVGGVRIEDNVIVTSDSSQTISTLSRGIEILK
jgi:Xaa-Pro dipeptidase